MPGTPRADPCVRLSRTRLLSRMMAARLPHAVAPLVHGLPPLCAARVGLDDVLLDRPASLQPLRRVSVLFVRGLRWHYRAVRLPDGVHARLMAHRFPFPAVGFSRRRDLLVPVQEVSRHALRFFDSAEPDALLRWRSRPCGLPHTLTASALESKRFRSSIALPACAPVYASRPASRPAPQDSGSGWLARPSLYDSFIRDFLLVSPAHQGWSLTPHPARALLQAGTTCRAPAS